MILRARSRRLCSSADTLGRRSALARKPADERQCAPTITFSRTGIVRNIARFWKVRPMPMPAIWCVGVLVIDLPSNRMSPAWYWYSRLRQLNSVVLPAPLGPIRPQMSPFFTSKLTPSSATMPPKRTVTPRTLSKGSARFGMGWRVVVFGACLQPEASGL